METLGGLTRETLRAFYGKRVFITGHTGFKGSWLCSILTDAGADVTGYALPPPDGPSLFALLRLQKTLRSVSGDVRDYEALAKAFENARPEYVIHLAAQPLVQESYLFPSETYSTNVMGTVNLLECLRKSDAVSALNVTTDKVYRNEEWVWGYRESDALGGYDPYSSSKSCSEIITKSYRDCFFTDCGPSLSTARAGNVLGGGDFAQNRILPDCIRFAVAGKTIEVRNPHSIRPYQHVLEPLFAYLLILQSQISEPSLQGCYNVGPEEQDCVDTGTLAALFCKAWGKNQSWRKMQQSLPHEASFLKLDCSKIKQELLWQPRWSVEKAVEKTVEWAKIHLSGGDIKDCMEKQIAEYLGGGAE